MTLRLCYVEEPWAFFTPRPIAEQRGDDWDDAPYQHNAGRPYGDDIVRVAFEGSFEAPKDGPEDFYSVEQVNAGKVPWLCTWPTSEGFLNAGATLEEFRAFVRENDGEVYEVVRAQRLREPTASGVLSPTRRRKKR